MCKNSQNIGQFVEYLRAKGINEITDENLVKEFEKYPGLPRNVKDSITCRALSHMVKSVCRKNHFLASRIACRGRRIYSYTLMHTNAGLEGEIKIEILNKPNNTI